ncbi:hypothetical protein [Streptomyces sp. NBC_01571]|uniref:hypothetical protein n=1 Tax=Streptomyces sp. NBC_01571 TaxID=2975883 RepID=UPI002B1CB89C|nr:hypothetical protein [Streptomyces sp. NBC_01571]
MGASTAVVCLSAVLAACGSGGGGGGHVAAGVPGGSGRAVAPTGDVSLAPLAGGSASHPGKGPRGDAGAAADGTTRPAGSPGPPGPSSDVAGKGAGAGSGAGTGGPPAPASTGGNPGRAQASSGSGPTTAPPTHPAPSAPAPAAVQVGAPEREATGQRWCEKVTLSFRNTGGTAVRSGTVTLGTHIIGALGIDWATIGSTRDLPAPIAPGAGTRKSWTVCVDAWRVPLGMHIETRDVSVQWK